MYKSFEVLAKDLVNQYKTRVAEKILTTEFNVVLDKFKECFKISDMNVLVPACLGKIVTISVNGEIVSNPKDIQLQVLAALISSQFPRECFWKIVYRIGLDDNGDFKIYMRSKDSILHTLSSKFIFENIEEVAKFTDPENELLNNLIRFKNALER